LRFPDTFSRPRTSPALSNLIARRLDARLSGICRKLGWTYTRYADDLTFSTSGEAPQQIGYLLARVRHIARDEGFAVNEKKTRMQRRNSQQSVTGLVVNDAVGVPRRGRLKGRLKGGRLKGGEG
jgi:RNA-directed DNA polymerase